VSARVAARRSLAAIALAALAAFGSVACTSSKAADAGGSSGGSSGMSDMENMVASPAPVLAEAAPKSTGLADRAGGYVYLPSTDTVAAGRAATFTFHITGPDDHAVTRYQPFESQLVVFYLIRSDLTGYSEFNPTMREDGTWTVELPALPAGSYRTYVAFAAPDSSAGTPLRYVLSSALSVPGQSTGAPLPAPSLTTTTDGYTVTLSGQLKAGVTLPLEVAVTKGGKSVGYFDRYLDGYAHLTAFRTGDAAFAHTLSTGRAGGPNGTGPLTAQALFPESGRWRLFIQFETAGKLHTAALTVDVS
jgi:hypothetical protein